MRETRTVQARKDQYLVALPASVRKHLGVLAGAPLYFHVGVKGRVTLTTTGRARGGRPRLETDCPQCAAFRRELDRLRAAGRMHAVADYNTAFAQGYERAQKDLPLWRIQFNALRDDVQHLSRVVSELTRTVLTTRDAGAPGPRRFYCTRYVAGEGRHQVQADCPLAPGVPCSAEAAP